ARASTRSAMLSRSPSRSSWTSATSGRSRSTRSRPSSRSSASAFARSRRVPRPKKGPRLGSGPDHQRLLLSTLASQLFVHEAIDTTEAKAKLLRPYAEQLITKAKKGDLSARRQVLKDIPDRDIV